jgi:DNA polymerase III subunit epsilon
MTAAFPLRAFSAADTETTNKDPEQARLLEICFTLAVPGRETDIRTTLVDPGDNVEVPEEATKVNGLTLERVRSEGKPAAEVLDVWLNDIAHTAWTGMPLIIQNAPYDLTVLDREARRNGVPTLNDRLDGAPLYVLDPLVLDKRCIKYRRKVSAEQGARCLKTLAAVYGIDWDDDKAHGAEFDTITAARVVWRISQWCRKSRTDLAAMRLGPFTPAKPMHRNDIAAFQSLADLSLADLQVKQADWYRQQTESFGQWLVEQRNEWLAKASAAEDDEGRTIAEQEAAELETRIAGLCTDWPFRPYVAEGVAA